MGRCRNYVGVSCIDGTCPQANKDYYVQIGMELTITCDECIYYKGCEDCALFGAEYCNGEHRNAWGNL